MGERELVNNVIRNINECSHFGKTLWMFLKTLQIKLPYDPALPFLGMYTKDSISCNSDTYLHIILIATLF